MYRTAAFVCVLIAGTLLARFGYSVYVASEAIGLVPNDGDAGAGRPAGRSLDVENAEQDLGNLPIGEHPVVFRVTNSSDQPGEVVGYPKRCDWGVCLTAKEEGRVSVPPGATVTLAGTLTVTRKGPFEFEGDLYLSDGGRLQTVPLKITGTGVPGGTPHAPPP